MDAAEKLRLQLLEEERKLRAKQPEHWAKSKYRKYAAKPTAEERELIMLRGMQIKKQEELAKKEKKKKPALKKKKK
jgi:hypothetical protein